MKKQLLAALLACAVLASVYFLTRETSVKVGILELDMPKFIVDSVTRIEFSGKEEFSIQGSGQGYVLTAKSLAGKDLEVSTQTVKELLDAVAGVNSGVFVTSQSGKHEDFKVDDREGQRVTVFAGQNAVWDLIIGDYASEGGRFVRIPSQDAVFLSKARFWDITRNNMNDFREHQIVYMDSSEVKEIRLYKKQQLQFSLIKRNELEWTLDDKSLGKLKNKSLNTSKTEEYVDFIRDLRATNFVDDNDKALQVENLFSNQGSVLMIVRNNGTSIELEVARNEKEKKSYVRRKDKGSIFEISDYLSTKIVASVNEFIDESGS